MCHGIFLIVTSYEDCGLSCPIYGRLNFCIDYGSAMGILLRFMFTRNRQVTDNNQQGTRLCKGGQSWNCRHDQHKCGKIPDVFCYRCNIRLGCSSCVRLSEVICLQCHNYGHRYGVAKHGNLVPNVKIPRVRTDKGWIKLQSSSDPVSELVNMVLS